MFATNFYLISLFISILHIPLLETYNKSDYSNYVPRVVNGRPGKLGDTPYQIAFKALIKRSRIYVTFCGGVIIAPAKLLSAAHCFSDDQNFCQRLCSNNKYTRTRFTYCIRYAVAYSNARPAHLTPRGHARPVADSCRVSAGSEVEISYLHTVLQPRLQILRGLRSLSRKYAVAGNLWNRGYHSEIDSIDNGQWRKLNSVVYPNTYKFPKDDIAIVFTIKPFTFNNYVNYIPYASKRVDYQGECLTSGFGRISKTMSSDKLLLASLVIIPTAQCNKMHRRNMRKFVCTSSIVTDVGKGDSGGPLVCTNTGDPKEESGKGLLVGIVSGNRRHIGTFFTRVSSFYKYIEKNYCPSTHIDINIFYVILIIQIKFLLFSFGFIYSYK